MNNFDITTLQAGVDSIWNPAKFMVEDSYSGKRLDFNSPLDVTILNRLSDHTTGCGDPLFATDSWIPSTAASSAITCKGFTNPATNAQCTTVTMRNAASGCSGCMDAQNLFKNLAGTIAADLAVRYPNCGTWIGELTNVNTKFYSLK